MNYDREITRRHRTAFILALDQSGSMAEPVRWVNGTKSKAEALAIITSRLVEELVLRAQHDEKIYDYYDVALVGYSNDKIYSLLGGEPAFLSIAQLAEQRPAVEHIASEWQMPEGQCQIFHEPVTRWVQPQAAGTTPMYDMFTALTRLVEGWCANPQNEDNFPPVIFHITDGMATDASVAVLRQAVERLTAQGTSVGDVLLANIDLSAAEGATPMLFPTLEEVAVADNSVRDLASLSSLVPQIMEPAVALFRGDGSHGPYVMMSCNASLTEVIALLNIGSRTLITNHNRI